MNNFSIIFEKSDDNVAKIFWKKSDQRNYRPANEIKEEIRDRRIVTILRKYLDLELKAGLLTFDKKDFEALGDLLFDLIFTSQTFYIEFKEWYEDALNDTSGEIYNLFLEFAHQKEFDDLAILPWEYIHYGYNKEKNKNHVENKIKEPFLAASNEVNLNLNFYRKIPLKFTNAYDRTLFQIKAPLKILLIISHPDDKEFTKSIFIEEIEYFKKLFDDHQGCLEIKYLYQPSPDKDNFVSQLKDGAKNDNKMPDFIDLENKIENHEQGFSPHIIHFIGHGEVDSKNGKLVFTKKRDEIVGFWADSITDNQFSNCIENSGLKPLLVFLQICNGGRIVNYVEKTGTAISLLQKQIPFVIAMQNPIQEDNALSFTKTFYDSFLNGKDIGSSVTAARFELAGKGEYIQKAFGSPVLFTYVDIPLTLNITGDDKDTDEVVFMEDDIIKFCNNEGCVKYRKMDQYSPNDSMCSECEKPLSSMVLKSPSRDSDSQVPEMSDSGTETGRSNLRRETEPKKHRSGTDSRNDRQVRPSGQWET